MATTMFTNRDVVDIGRPTTMSIIISATIYTYYLHQFIIKINTNRKKIDPIPSEITRLAKVVRREALSKSKSVCGRRALFLYEIFSVFSNSKMNLFQC